MKLLIQKTNETKGNIKKIELTSSDFENNTNTYVIKENESPIIYLTDTESSYFIDDIDSKLERVNSETVAIITMDDLISLGGGTGVQSVTGPGVDNTDPLNPIVSSDINDVSATQSGIVNNTALQELGGVDKTINGVRIGRGNGNSEENTAFGFNTLNSNTTGIYNVGVGVETLSANTTGQRNLAIGAYALYSNQIGDNNTAIGVSSMQNGTAPSRNVGIGDGSLYNSNAQRNVAIGVAAMQNNTSGSGNVSIGHQAGGNLTTGNDNIILGNQSTTNAGLTTGSNNIIISQNEGAISGVTTGSGNTIVGKTTGNPATMSNTVLLADGVGNIAIRKASNHELTAPTLTNALITSGGTKSLTTKEYNDATYTKFGTVAPASSADTGTVGEIRIPDDGFLYICVATNTWNRVAIATW